MDPLVRPEDIPTLPRPLTLAQVLAIETYKATGLIARRFQANIAVRLIPGCDALCFSGTGTGKTLAFIMACFLIRPASSAVRDWGLRAVSVNAATLTPQLLKDIKASHHQVVISSPELHLDQNKLRGALLLKELESYRHITAVDEAHVIKLWGGDFRKAYECIGDMRVLMPNPTNSPMLAATATASDAVKDSIRRALHIRRGYHIENLGNFRRNLRYEVHGMKGGQQSFHEVCNLLPPVDTPLSNVEQTIIFVEDYQTAHAVAHATRRHFGITGISARNNIPVYHSLKSDLSKQRIARCFKCGKARILVSTEALTMGADFPNVKKIINYLVPAGNETWVQQSGRAGRSSDAPEDVCRVIIMATPKMLADAVSMCVEAGIPINRQLLDLKVEEDAKDDENEEPLEPAARDKRPAIKGAKGRHQMLIGMAEYLGTNGCRVAVLDCEFNNPEHEPCKDFGGCDNCILEQLREDELDRLAVEQQAKREEIEHSIEQYDGESEQRKHKARQQAEDDKRSTADRQVFKTVLEDWRKSMMLDVLKTIDLCKDVFMTDKELLRIAKSRKIKTVADFDDPAVWWPGQPEWRAKLLDVILGLECKQEEERRQEELETQRKAQEQQQERQRKEQEKGARRSGSTQTSLDTPQPPEQPPLLFDTPMVPASHTSLPSDSSLLLPPGRPVSTIRLGPNRRPIAPIPLTPSAPVPAPSLSFVNGYPSPISPNTPLFPLLATSNYSGPSGSIARPSHVHSSAQPQILFTQPILHTPPALPATPLPPTPLHSQSPALATPSRP